MTKEERRTVVWTDENGKFVGLYSVPHDISDADIRKEYDKYKALELHKAKPPLKKGSPRLKNWFYTIGYNLICTGEDHFESYCNKVINFDLRGEQYFVFKEKLADKPKAAVKLNVIDEIHTLFERIRELSPADSGTDLSDIPVHVLESTFGLVLAIYKEKGLLHVRDRNDVSSIHDYVANAKWGTSNKKFFDYEFREQLAKLYPEDPTSVKAWLLAHTDKDDWDEAPAAASNNTKDDVIKYLLGEEHVDVGLKGDW